MEHDQNVDMAMSMVTWEGVKNVFFDNGVVDAVSTFLSDVRLCDAGTFVVVYWFE
jgi:hypothetical protein